MSSVNLISRKQELQLHGESTSLFLQIMISIAVFIFAITLSGVLSINSMLNNWNNSILGSLTVQIMPINNMDKEKALAETLAHQDKAMAFLKELDGVESVVSLSDAQLAQLIQPWLGDDVNIDKLPVPRIIDVKLEKNANIDFNKLSADLNKVSEFASVDNHKLWLNKLITFANGLKFLATAILALVILITSGAIFYTTKMSLGLHKTVIEILHIMGAKDAYIAQQYARRMGALALIGGLFAIVFAVPTIFIIGNLAMQIEGGIISDANLNNNDWMLIVSLPLFSLTIAMLTAYYTVKQTLHKMI